MLLFIKIEINFILAIKDPPYTLKESGYAGFEIPIDIYLKNKDEPKKIQFKYDLNLQNEGPAISKVQKEKYVFHNPSEEFKKKLLKGGGIFVNSTIESDKNKECDNKLQLTGKPKLGADMMKKHKTKEHRSEEPKLSSFAHLFGTPISTGSKASPDPKKTSPVPPKTITSIPSRKDDRNSKEKLDKSKSKLSPSKDKDGIKTKEGQDKVREDKKKLHGKDRDRSKEKINKLAISPRPKSPKHISPSLSNSSITRTETDQQKIKVENDSKKSNDVKDRKIKKEKKAHDREKKDHKKDREREKESSKEIKSDQKSLIKDKEHPLRDVVVTKDKARDKDKILSMKNEIPKLDIEPKIADAKSLEKKDLDRRHKHKKKDKTRKDEPKIDKEKKNKIDRNFTNKVREDDSLHADDMVMKMDDDNIHETNAADNLSEQQSSDSEESIKSIEEPVKQRPEAVLNSPLNEAHFNNMDKQKLQKKYKEKIKNFDKEDKRRKRKMKEEHAEKPKIAPQPPPKVQKMDDDINSDMDTESLDTNENNEQIHMDNESISIELSESTDLPCSPTPEEKAFTPDYMSELKELQHKIMTLQDNTEIQDIVQMVAETGQFEITKKTFDFDLCTLDRSTVQRLQEFFASS